MSEHIFTIDIEKIIEEKAGDKFRFFPRFLVNWLKKIIHQDELNEFLVKEGNKQGVPWLKDCVRYLDMTLHVHGLENLPASSTDKRYTFVSNHPLGGQDGVAIGAVLGDYFNGNIKFIVNDLLMNLPGLAPLCVPVNKIGNVGKKSSAQIAETFKSESHIIMFPAGLVSRKINNVISDLDWKKTFIVKSVETQRDVIPLHFSGQNSNRFYRLSNFSKLFRIKFNLAMLLLVDEMFKNRHKTFTISIGKPIPWQTFDKSKNGNVWANFVKNKVYALSENTCDI